MQLLLKNALAFIEGAFQKTDIFVVDGKITAFAAPCCCFENVTVLDCEGKYLLPGFIDIHTHGAVGIDVNAADEADFEKISAFFASKGVTAYLASVLTDSEKNTLRVLDTISGYCLGQKSGAKLLGAHLEGPFLSVERKGAMPEEYLKNADEKLFARYFQSGAVRYITIAPEVSGALQLIKAISSKLPVALGHSEADYETAKAAIALGARASTHTFNAMRGIDRVEPAILGAVLEGDVYNEIICDGFHVHPANIRLLYRLKGKEKMIAVTDSIQATGMPDGVYKLGKNDVSVQAGEAFLNGTATRAGSVLTADAALRNMVEFLGVGLEKVIPMFTQNPAMLLGLNKGFIRIGYDADFVLLNQQLQVERTIVAGKF